MSNIRQLIKLEESLSTIKSLGAKFEIIKNLSNLERFKICCQINTLPDSITYYNFLTELLKNIQSLQTLNFSLTGALSFFLADGHTTATHNFLKHLKSAELSEIIINKNMGIIRDMSSYQYYSSICAIFESINGNTNIKQFTWENIIWENHSTILSSRLYNIFKNFYKLLGCILLSKKKFSFSGNTDSLEHIYNGFFDDPPHSPHPPRPPHSPDLPYSDDDSFFDDPHHSPHSPHSPHPPHPPVSKCESFEWFDKNEAIFEPVLFEEPVHIIQNINNILMVMPELKSFAIDCVFGTNYDKDKMQTLVTNLVQLPLEIIIFGKIPKSIPWMVFISQLIGKSSAQYMEVEFLYHYYGKITHFDIRFIVTSIYDKIEKDFLINRLFTQLNSKFIKKYFSQTKKTKNIYQMFFNTPKDVQELVLKFWRLSDSKIVIIGENYKYGSVGRALRFKWIRCRDNYDDLRKYAIEHGLFYTIYGINIF